MAYTANDDGAEIYMATRRSPKKFKNLAENPAVSLMLDMGEDIPRSQARALTVEGTCTSIEDNSMKRLIQA